MKKVLIVLMCFAVLICFAACAEAEQEEFVVPVPEEAVKPAETGSPALPEETDKPIEYTPADTSSAELREQNEGKAVLTRAEYDAGKSMNDEELLEYIITNSAKEGEKLGEIPVYEEASILYYNEDEFTLTEEACFDYFYSGRGKFIDGMINVYHTDAMRMRDDGTMYFMYDIDTGYRLYIFAENKKYENLTMKFEDRELEPTSYSFCYDMPIGYPVVIGEVLEQKDFSHLKIGDPIEAVEAVDSVAEVQKRLITDIWKTEPIGVQNRTKMGMPITTVHYLKDGLLKIEYEMHDDRSITITDIYFNEDYEYVNRIGMNNCLKILEEDLPQ